MILHSEINDELLRRRIRHGIICFAGNNALKIYGRLHCRSGKRMKKKNRVFFQSGPEAVLLGFRPCGHCMNKEYKKWKHGAH